MGRAVPHVVCVDMVMETRYSFSRILWWKGYTQQTLYPCWWQIFQSMCLWRGTFVLCVYKVNIICVDGLIFPQKAGEMLAIAMFDLDYSLVYTLFELKEPWQRRWRSYTTYIITSPGVWTMVVLSSILDLSTPIRSTDEAFRRPFSLNRRPVKSPLEKVQSDFFLQKSVLMALNFIPQKNWVVIGSSLLKIVV